MSSFLIGAPLVAATARALKITSSANNMRAIAFLTSASLASTFSPLGHVRRRHATNPFPDNVTKRRSSGMPTNNLNAVPHPDDGILPRSYVANEQRDVSKLTEWASSRGIEISNDVAITSDVSVQGCGVRANGAAAKGAILLSVPRSLVLSSADLPADITEDVVLGAISILSAKGVSEYLPEFRLMVRLLIERAAGRASPWHQWISTLPSSFTTGLYLDEPELSYLSPYVLALVDFQKVQLDAFDRAASAVAQSCDALSSLFGDGKRAELVKWAFSIVFTRSWRSQSGTDATIVPVGDMFNHNEQADIEVVEPPGSDCISFALTKDIKTGRDIYLSYGPHSPANFFAVFGFVDESMSTVPSQIDVPAAANERKLTELGCTERTRMVYGRDGRVYDTVWDYALFALLASRPAEQDEFFDATVSGKVSLKESFHSKYALEVSMSLLAHVEMVIGTYPDLSNVKIPNEDLFSRAMLPMVLRYNEIMREAYQKVKLRLEEKVQDERNKRLAMLSSS